MLKSAQYKRKHAQYKFLHSPEDLNKLKGSIHRRMRFDKRIKVKVHLGTCGISAGAFDVWNKFQEEIRNKKLQSKILLSKAGCIGMCSIEPSVTIVSPSGEIAIYKEITVEKVSKIIEEHLIKGKPVKDYVVNINDPYFKFQERRVLRNQDIDPRNIEDYISRDGYLALVKVLTEMSQDDVVEEIEKSGLKGRGGAGFRTGLKWKFAAIAKSEKKYVVCNADEGDPGAYMNRVVLEGNPQSIIEGMIIAGYAIGSNQGYIYVRAEYPLAVETLEHAIEQAKRYGLLGLNILDSGFDFNLEICLGAGAFVCGEETALLASLMGERGSPRPRPPFPAQKGLLEQPTIINNVETLSIVPAILLYGHKWFREVGSNRCPGTKTLCLVGKAENSGIIEVPLGTPLGKIVFDIGGGIKNGKKFKAVLIGGPSGGCLSAEHLNIPVEYEAIDALGAIMGSGGIVVLDEDDCMVDIAKFFLEFTKDESCGKCVPCRAGIPQMLELLNKIRKGDGSVKDIERLEELARIIKATSLCGLGQTAPNPVLTTLHYFRDEYMSHVIDKKCLAVVCQALFESPCQHACPVGLDTPGYIALIKEGRFDDAYRLIKQRLPFPSICGRVCHTPCESKCLRDQIDESMAIRHLKRFVADYAIKNKIEYKPLTIEKKKDKVAIIGAGPAGLACAYYLAIYGYNVEIFEASKVIGGILSWGIPEYRLPKDILQKEIEEVKKLGVKIKLNSWANNINELFSKGFKAIFIAIGSQKVVELNIPGENLQGVYDALDFLKRVNLKEPIEVGKKTAIIGGGNAAIDSARMALRKGAEVYLFYRRERKDMPAIEEEICAAEEEGIKFHCLTSPTKIIGEKGKVNSIKFISMRLGEFDKSARKKPFPIQGSEFIFEVDTVIEALGQKPDIAFLQSNGLEHTKTGWVLVDKRTLETNREGVFAGGDIVSGPATVIDALSAGKKAASSINKFIEGRKSNVGINFEDMEIKISSVPIEDEDIIEKPKIKPRIIQLSDRRKTTEEVILGYNSKEARKEAERCLRCDLEVED